MTADAAFHLFSSFFSSVMRVLMRHDYATTTSTTFLIAMMIGGFHVDICGLIYIIVSC